MGDGLWVSGCWVLGAGSLVLGAGSWVLVEHNYIMERFANSYKNIIPFEIIPGSISQFEIRHSLFNIRNSCWLK